MTHPYRLYSGNWPSITAEISLENGKFWLEVPTDDKDVLIEISHSDMNRLALWIEDARKALKSVKGE